MIKSKRIRWAGHAARIRERQNAYWILVGMLEGKRPKTTVRNLQVPYIAGEFLSSYTIGGFSRRAQLLEGGGDLKITDNGYTTFLHSKRSYKSVS
jgi:hypothetical protein